MLRRTFLNALGLAFVKPIERQSQIIMPPCLRCSLRMSFECQNLMQRTS